MDYAGSVLAPQTPEELAEAMGSAGSAKQTVTLGGAFSKRLMAGPVAPADVTISASGLKRVLQYDPRDLTISVEAGVTWCEMARVLGEHRQMVPLDPPFSGSATIGGIVASNTCGPRRRLYGTARDLIIGMKFATLAGKLVQSGGMVVKNVAGLDMAKLMIGSFGTLAAIAVVNFKVQPKPLHERSFVLEYATLAEAAAARDSLLRGVLQPAAIDLLSTQRKLHAGRAGGRQRRRDRALSAGTRGARARCALSKVPKRTRCGIMCGILRRATWRKIPRAWWPAYPAL